jgi:Mn2+/Fe2+ NRAMP family transporter
MDHDQQDSAGDSAPDGAILSPPETVFGIIRRLGPGLIIAGSIVGSGELIATTKTGAEAGFWLLWLILIGCVIKVFVQGEFGRFSIVTGLTTMDGLNAVPGPVFEFAVTPRAESTRLRGNWLVWYWFLMWLASIGQLGGIVGGVGQALSISLPLTEAGRRYNQYVDLHTQLKVSRAELATWNSTASGAVDAEGQRVRLPEKIRRLQAEIAAADRAWVADLGAERFEELGRKPPPGYDDRLWATLIAVVTAVILAVGRYGLIQSFSTVLVCGFTFVTIGNLFALQMDDAWRVTWHDLAEGLQFRLPPQSEGALSTAFATALATFGIIGVGAAEIIAYPYWCLEKGYARFTGPRDASSAWAERAAGWMRVMRWDAWCSMVVYTFATLAFYLLGAAILGRSGLNPAGSEMIRTLAVMYEPVFSEWAAGLFLFGAFAVLYSTYFVANAGHARVFSDALGVLGAAAQTPTATRRRVAVLSGLFPLLCLVIYLCFPAPARLVLISGVMQAVMLPMLAGAALYFRYFRSDQRLAPGRLWDAFLLLSAAGMSVAGLWTLVQWLTPAAG